MIAYRSCTIIVVGAAWMAVIALPSPAAPPMNGCALLPKDEVAQVLGGTIDSATPWPTTGQFACMYEGSAIPGLDLMVDLLVAGPDAQRRFDQAASTLYKGVPVAGVGDKAAWSSARVNGSVAETLDVLAGRYVVSVTFLGSPKVAPDAGADLARARSLARHAIAGAKEHGL